jgi:hypothetical protein
VTTCQKFSEIAYEHRRSDYGVFEDVFNVKIDLSTRDEDNALIVWNSRNGYVDELQGGWTYTFRLVKDDDVWKVGFLPLQ